MKRTVEEQLRLAATNDFGYLEAIPGTDMTGRKTGHMSEWAWEEAIRRGYTDNYGRLTKAGYNAI